MEDSNLDLAFKLIGDELADQTPDSVETLDHAIGRIVRELIRICMQSENGSEEELLDSLVRIAATATRAVADQGVQPCREGGDEC